MSLINFVRGEPVCLRAKVGFNCGDLERQINRGDEVWFDGYTVDFGDGVAVLYPKLRSAIKAEWLGLAEDVPVLEEVPVQDEAQFRMTVVDHEEEVVGEVMDPKKVVANNDKNFFEGREELLQPKQQKAAFDTLVAEERVHAAAADSAEDFFHPNSRSPKPQKTESHTSGIRQMEVVADEPEGVVIGSVDQFQKAAKASNLTDDQREAMLIEALGPDADAVKAVQKARQIKDAAKAQGKTEAEASVEARKAARKAQAQASQASVEAEEAPADTSSNLVNIGPGIQWDLSRPWATRAKDAIDNFADYPGLLKGILAVETEAVQKRIQKAIDNK